MRNLKYIFLLLIIGGFLFTLPKTSYAIEQSSSFASTMESLGVEVRLLCESGCGRSPNSPVTPERIIMHVTQGSFTTAEGEWGYFNSGSEGRNVGSHFIIGNAGDTIQAVIMGDTQVEYAQTVGGYRPHISIEMTSRRSYDSKAEMPEVQYKAAYDLVRALMQQYNIPLGGVQFDENFPNDNGVYGHYQMAPSIKTDPGAGWLRDFRADLLAGGALPSTSLGGGGSRTATGCFVTAVGNPEGEKPLCETISGPAGSCQLAPEPPSDIRQAIIDKWGITLNISDPQLRLAWEEFHEIDCTGFLQDLRGTLVDSWGANFAQQFSCPGTNGAQGATDIMFPPQWTGEFMKAILVHELTHVWQFCSTNGETNLLAVGQAYIAEGGLTRYSRSECPGFGVRQERRHHEDQADTIALFLNPDQGELTCGDGAENPFKGGGFPRHSTAAEQGVGKR